MSWTDRFRVLFASLFAVLVITATVGWLFFDLDPARLGDLLNQIAIAIGVGEASNVGKRATFKKEAVIDSADYQQSFPESE